MQGELGGIQKREHSYGLTIKNASVSVQFAALKKSQHEDLLTAPSIKTLPVGFREECFFVVNVPRLHCRSCDGLHYLDIKIAEQRKSYTKQLANLIILFCIAAISDIAGLLRMNWAAIKDVVKFFLHKKFSKPDLS
ncbi:MAG: hypothetical protein LBP22_08090, partial [Deltaproteobacteria bacterium]|nr:hypothetical protein [Deltaproteobacteria bacterium]